MAPTIIVLKNKLNEITHLEYCEKLKLALIEGLNTRFVHIFDLESPKSKPYILSSISHPKFKMNWIPKEYQTICKTLFTNECNLLYAHVSSDAASATLNSETDSEEDFFGTMYGKNSDSPTSSTINIASVQALSYLDCKKKELTSLENFPIIKSVFLKYNVSLPSSAPVERLFSSGSLILTPHRNRMSDDVFEKLLCCRRNEF